MSVRTQLDDWREKTEKFPEIVQCESTNMCNAACIMCPVTTQMTRPKVHMSREIFHKVVDDCVGEQVYEFHLHQQGEPLLIGVEEFVYRLKYAKKALNPQGTRVGFFTNGSMMYPDVSRRILQSVHPDFVAFSFDGGDKESYEAVRIGLQFQSVVSNVKYFARLKHEMGLDGKVRIQTINVVNKLNEMKVNEYMKLFANSHIDDVGTAGMVNYGGSKNTEAILHRFQKRANGKGMPCWRLWTNMVIQSNGKVALCCQEHDGRIEMGDVMNNSVKEIWQGEVFSEWRLKHRQGKQAELEVCKNCDYMDWFTAPAWYFGDWRG